MPKVTYLHPDDSSDVLEVAIGVSVMQGAVSQGIDGIVAECGGSAMCATFHVYVDPAWVDRLPDRDTVEDELLDNTSSPREDNSRLSCQIAVGEDLDGLVVRVPETQE